jgi:hypothetical protein
VMKAKLNQLIKVLLVLQGATIGTSDRARSHSVDEGLDVVPSTTWRFLR